MTTDDLFVMMQCQCQDLSESLEKYLKEINLGNRYALYMDKDCGKYAIVRKITTLRQTLLRIEKGL